jgi:hypothetical protein
MDRPRRSVRPAPLCGLEPLEGRQLLSETPFDTSSPLALAQVGRGEVAAIGDIDGDGFGVVLVGNAA